MKFYYEGALIRTSKSHHYTHAVLAPNGKAISCSSSREGAEKVKQSEINNWGRIVENHRSAIKAIEAGQKYYSFKEGNRTTKAHVNGTLESYERALREAEKAVEIVRSYKVVELEARD